jgi:superfamily II DNA or RNA helicase
LALSATIERYRDEEGTRKIFEFFGEKCVEYPMSRAINENKLTKYRYYPILVTLNSDEINEYMRLTKLVRQNSYPNSKGKVELTKKGEMYAIQRARLIAGCNSKLPKLKEEMQKHLHEKNMLVYCGTSKLSGDHGEEVKQIDEACKMLGLELGMKIERYTSQETAEERIIIKNRFQNGDLQALVAIKCLDEGVNIPGIRTAFILASSTNPREYVQRRGRVLRKADDKDFSIIYDFVTLPFDIFKPAPLSEGLVDDFKTLASNELKRIEEFGDLSLNPTEALEFSDKIKEVFHLNEFTINNEFDEIEWNEESYE